MDQINKFAKKKQGKNGFLPAPVLLRIDGLPFIAPMANVVDVA